MVHWIVILVALVCLSGSSFSRSWVGYDDSDGVDSWHSDHDDELNWKPKYYSGSWDSAEHYDDSGYDHGYGNDKTTSSNQGYQYQNGRDSHAFGYHDDHHVDHYHGYYDKWGPRGHHSQSAYPGYPGQNCGSHEHHSQHGTPSQSGQNWGSHKHHGQHGTPGQPGQNWGPQAGSQSQSGSGQTGPNTGSVRIQTGSPGQPSQNTVPSRGLHQNNRNPQQGSRNDGDRIVFPDFNNQVPTTRSPATTRPTVTTARTPTTTRAPTTTDRTLLDLVVCIRACPTTSEYNPVCGTNNVTYSNPGALQCARNCGLNVAVARRAPCPRIVVQPTTVRPITNVGSTRPTPISQTTAWTFPTVTPTRFTSIDVNSANRPSTVSLEILQSIFGNAPPTNSNTEEPEFDIDKRRKP